MQATSWGLRGVWCAAVAILAASPEAAYGQEPAESGPAAGVARVHILSNVPVTLRERPGDGTARVLAEGFEHGHMDLRVSSGFQASAPGYSSARFFLSNDRPGQRVEITLRRPIARGLGITLATLGAAGLVVAAYGAIGIPTGALVGAACYGCGSFDQTPWWAMVGIGLGAGLALTVPAILLLRAPGSRAVVQAGWPG